MTNMRRASGHIGMDVPVDSDFEDLEERKIVITTDPPANQTTQPAENTQDSARDVNRSTTPMQH